MLNLNFKMKGIENGTGITADVINGKKEKDEGNGVTNKQETSVCVDKISTGQFLFFFFLIKKFSSDQNI